MLEKYNKLQPNPNTTDVLKVTLQMIWEKLPQEHINMVVVNFTKRLTAYMAVVANDGTPSICSNSVLLKVCILISSPETGSFHSHQQTTGEEC